MGKYQRHKSPEYRNHIKRLRRERIILLLPLLSALCFVIGICLLLISLIAFRNVLLSRWLWFSLAYLAAGLLFSLSTLTIRWLQPEQSKLKRR